MTRELIINSMAMILIVLVYIAGDYSGVLRERLRWYRILNAVAKQSAKDRGGEVATPAQTNRIGGIV